MGWIEWFIISGIGAAVVVFVDIKWIYPASQGYMWRKNPEWVEFKDEFAKLQEEIKEIKDEIHRLRNKQV